MRFPLPRSTISPIAQTIWRRSGFHATRLNAANHVTDSGILFFEYRYKHEHFLRLMRSSPVLGLISDLQFRRVAMSSPHPPTQSIPAGKFPPLYTVIRSQSQLPLSPSQITNLSLKPYVALDWMVRYGVCEDSALLVLQHAFLSEALCHAGHLAYAHEIVVRAQTRLAEFYANATKSGRWQLDDDTYAALQSALSVYIAQLPLISGADLQRAGILIKEWKKSYRKEITQARQAIA